MAHGRLGPVVPGIVRCGLMPVAIGRETLIGGQFGNRRQPVGQRAVGAFQQRQIHPGQQRLTPGAVERDKVVGGRGPVGQTRTVFSVKNHFAGFAPLTGGNGVGNCISFL